MQQTKEQFANVSKNRVHGYVHTAKQYFKWKYSYHMGVSYIAYHELIFEVHTKSTFISKPNDNGNTYVPGGRVAG